MNILLIFLPSFLDLGLPTHDIDEGTNLKTITYEKILTTKLCTNLETTCDVVDTFEVIIDSSLSLVRIKKDFEKSS